MLDRLTRLFEPTPRTAEAWLVRMGRPETTARDLAAFEAWLDADPARLDAYQDLKATQRQARALKADLTAELATIPRQRRNPNRRSAGLLIGGPIAAALGAAVLALTLWPDVSPFGPADPMAGATTYTTQIGEIRDVRLADGSRVTLDTGSAIRVALSDDVRHVVLDHGRAYFEVRHDTARPFEVGVADRRVIVTGTRFTTTLADGAASVLLVEGSVSLSPSGSGETLRMAPGDAVSYRSGLSTTVRTNIEPDDAAPWRQRRLVFRDEPLSEVLAELSRYTSVRLTARDPALRRLRVTAVFPLDDKDSVVARIDRLLPVTTTISGPDSVTVSPE